MFVGSINSKIRNLIFTEKELFREDKEPFPVSGDGPRPEGTATFYL